MKYTETSVPSARPTIHNMKHLLISPVITVLFLSSAATSYTATFIVPDNSTPAYLQFSNSPFSTIDFSTGYFYLETLEDNALNTPGVTASGGSVIGFADVGAAEDSVDADDGVIDGEGTHGHSYFGNGAFTFDFSASVLGHLPTHVGIVWTDGVGLVTIQAFDAGGFSLGSATGVLHSNGSITGEDRFYGVTDPGGISRIILSSGAAQEADHLQYGYAVPEPTTTTLLSIVFTACFARRTLNRTKRKVA